jgi:poly-gamma-glutamate biosynthesis protein PgsC/CapC
VHDYLLSTEMVRFAFVLGVAVSMLMYERRHLTTGSIVVPGYIASFIVFPLIILATFVNALVSYLIVNKLVRRWFLLYGRTKFTVLALTSILIQTAMLKFTPSGPWLWESDLKLFVGVGYVVPALIAHDMGRQGIAKTTKSVLISAAIVAVPIALALLVDMPGVNDLAPLQGVGDMAIEPAWIPVAVLLSAAASWGVAHNYGYRSGGFVGAAFIGMLLGDPWQIVIAVAIAATTYVIVTKFLMGSMILFGRRKFSAMLLVSSVLAWSLLWIGTELFGVGGQQHLDLGSLALTPLFVPGLLANDTQRTGPRQVLFGVSLAVTFVLSTTWWIQSLFEGLPLALGWKVVAVTSFAGIFWRQFMPARSEQRAAAPAPTPVPAPTTPATAGATPFGTAIAFGRSGFDRWAALHRDAADAADRWLTLVLGERAGSALAGDTAPAESNRTNVSSALHPERPTERIRRAAIRSLNSQPTSVSTSPSESQPLTRRTPAAATGTTRTAAQHAPGRPRPAEFDVVATGIAAGVTRPQPLPQRRPHATIGDTLFTPSATPAARQAARVMPDGRSASVPTPKTSEQSGAATRAHLSAAPDARTTLEDPEREEHGQTHVFPG